MESLEAGDLRAVGGYRLRARLGSGGIGQAYLGFSPPGRAAVVKVARPELAADAEFRFRLRQVVTTAQAVSSVYVARLLAAGPDDDPLWLAAAFVAGPSLADIVAEAGLLPPAAVWQLAAGMAEAVADIHGRGLVHGSLKPANVLLAIDGPRVADYWVHAALEAGPVPRAGLAARAPSFLSPEQADGGHLGPASDVFSLGALTAFAATGARPFGDGPTRLVTHRVVHAEPALDGMPGPLRDVAAACLAKDPAARPSLAQVRARLKEGDRQGHGSLASPWPSAVVSLIRWHQAHLDADLGHPGAEHGPPAVPTPLSVPPAGPQPAARSVPPAPPAAPEPASEPLRPSARPRRPQRRVITAAVAAVMLAVVATAAAVTLTRAEEQNGHPAATLASPGTSIGGVSSVAFSPDGKMLAAANADGDVYLWDVVTDRHTATLSDPASSGVNAVAFSPDGSTLATADADGSVYLWDAATGRRTATLTLPASATGVTSSALSVAFSPNGQTLAAGQNSHSVSTADGTAYLWGVTADSLTAALTDPFKTPSPGVMSVAFSPEGSTLAAGEGNGLTYLWNLTTARVTATLSDPSTGGFGPNSIAFSPDGTTLASATGGGSIYLWDVAHARRTATLAYPGARNFKAVAFSPNGTTLAGADTDGSTYLWKLSASPPQSQFLTDPGAEGVNAVAFSPRGSLLATADRDGSTYLWRLG